MLMLNVCVYLRWALSSLVRTPRVHMEVRVRHICGYTHAHDFYSYTFTYTLIPKFCIYYVCIIHVHVFTYATFNV